MSSSFGNPTTPLLVLIGSAIVTYLVARSMFGHNPHEPPLAPSSIPLVGHVVGLSRSSFNYYTELSKQIDAPIFTVSLPGQKIYIVTKPELIQQIQKQHRTLAFPPIEANFATIVLGLSKEGQAVLARNLNGDEGGHGLSMETYAAMRTALHPGPALDDMNRAMLAEINQSLDDLAPTDGNKQFGLFAWLRDNLTLATTRAVYGPLNPFDDREIRDAFWEFEAGLVRILVGFLTSITARKPVAARAKAVRAFEKYYKAGGIDKASAYARNRHEVEINNNFPAEDMARSSVGGTIALLVNTVPSVFWALLHLHAHPGLLAQARDEVDGCTRTDGATKTIDMASLKEKSPLLLSAYQEVLRYRAMGASVREVMEDTQLGGFLLKKGAMLQMPSRVIHTDESLWGATEYNPRRFLASEKDSRPRDVCFRAFGGGKTLCPGRHFATNEILAVVALWIARFDMRPVDGEWKMPTTAKTNVAAAIMGPDEDVQVEIATREGMERIRWQVKLEASDKTFAIVTEDVAEREE
ncbi:25-hydroxycholesterol 7-alpha-hydroxylase [Cytospora mali]|uniref:25-hydroxycholesterol 7-alpha-hydroxylase n=1 Tax=Cytospora mali TaxID=578113 RepID=A0A194UTN6_CYTMA|nr:25-hydroxycholesterol 7-alpha-hydroxylase [Valsa mali var. pyri (nom. inval.)]